MDRQLAMMAFIAVSTLVMIVYLLLVGRRTRVAARLAELSNSTSWPVGSAREPAAVVAAARPPKDPNQELKHRLVQAGLYKPRAHAAFVMMRIIIGIVPLGVCLLAAGMGLMTRSQSFLYGSMMGLTATLAPSMWLGVRKRARQSQIRRALPDVLDIVAVCLEGGLSLSAALARVGRELAQVHPMLANELSIVDREVQMGRTVGDAMRRFADRFDLEELRSLASVIAQTERYGASVAKAFVVYSETMRQRRAQHAEELAQTATVKILFPTLLLIFPAIFVVLLGPAAIQIYQTLIQDTLFK